MRKQSLKIKIIRFFQRESTLEAIKWALIVSLFFLMPYISTIKT